MNLFNPRREECSTVCYRSYLSSVCVTILFPVPSPYVMYFRYHSYLCTVLLGFDQFWVDLLYATVSAHSSYHNPSRVHHVQQLHEEGGTMPRRKEERGGWKYAEQKQNVAVSARKQARIIEKGVALLLSKREQSHRRQQYMHAEAYRDTSISEYTLKCMRVHSDVSFQYTHSHQYTRCHAWSSFHSVSTGGVSLV